MSHPSIEVLRALNLFEKIADESLSQVAAITQMQTASKDETIVRQNEKGDAMYIIAKGRVKVMLFGEDGKEVILTTLREGHFFGEMSLLDNEPRSATVIATEATELLVLRRTALLDTLKVHPEVALTLLAEMSHRLRIADQNIQSLALLDVYGRVARAILQLITEDGIQAGSNVVVEHRPTHQEIAARSGASRETVSRIMGDLSRAGLITIDGKRLIVHDEFLDQSIID